MNLSTMFSTSLILGRRFVGRVQRPAVSLLSTVPHIIESTEKVAKVENTITSSVVKHPYVLNKSTLIEDVVEDVDDKRLFAVVKFMGKQYKLTKDDVLVADNINEIDIGDSITLNDVLLLGSKHGTIVGRPFVSGAEVKLLVEELTKDKKVTTLKFRRRKNSRRTRGFRRQLTILRVEDIVPPSDLKADLDV